MPTQDLIDVRIVVNERPVAEYLEPDTVDEGVERVRYVEITAGQHFSVQVKWQPGFDLMQADGLCYKFEIDDSNLTYPYFISKTDVSHRNGRLVEAAVGTKGSIRLKNETTGRWEDCPFAFGALGITEDGLIDLSLTPTMVQRLGSIRIRVFRAKKTKRDTPYFWSGERPKVLNELPEKVLKGRALKHNVKYSDGRTSANQNFRHSEYHYNPMASEAGTVYQFNFLYRSRKTLQSLGCIPRSPSPSPDRQLALERAEDTIRETKQRERSANLEILRLREELARSQSGSRQSSIVIDGDPSTPAASRGERMVRVTPGRRSPRIKRESTVLPSLESTTTRPQPSLFADISAGQKRPRENDEDEERQNTTKRARQDISVADEVDEVLRSIEDQDTTVRAARSGTRHKRKRSEDDDDDDVIELQPKRVKHFEIVDLTED